jgi:hypothetical protein
MKILAAAALAAALAIAGSAHAAVIFFEGFDGYAPLSIAHGANGASSITGNTITTDYSYRVPNGQNHFGQPDSMYDEGTWTIGTNPIDVHDLWVDAPQPGNPFLMLNGATSDSTPPPTAYESKSIAVSGGTYNYSYDLLNLCCNPRGPAGTPSYLQLWYFANGSSTPTLISPVSHTVAASSGWENISGKFSVGAGTIRLGLSDNTTIASGNDFGVDNIKLASVPEPASWALMILGFGGAGAALRRRRQAAAAA